MWVSMGVKNVVLLLDEDQYNMLVKLKGDKNWVDFVIESTKK